MSPLTTIAPVDTFGPRMPNTTVLVILSLKRFADASVRSPDHRPRPQQPHPADIYHATIDQLGAALDMLAQGREPMFVGFQWLSNIPAGFLELVRTHQPVALAILAHYCVVLHHLRDRWWMGGWALAVLHEICDLLGPEEIKSISWALDATGFGGGGGRTWA